VIVLPCHEGISSDGVALIAAAVVDSLNNGRAGHREHPVRRS
jgi:hypothetical protein